MFKIATNHMVLRNQELIDSLNEWIRSFDIRKVSGENVSIAVTKCKAVIRALDGLASLQTCYVASWMALRMHQMKLSSNFA